MSSWIGRRAPVPAGIVRQALAELADDEYAAGHFPHSAALAEILAELGLRCGFVYTTRFERLVGARGGGSDHAQMEELCRIACHLDRPAHQATLRAAAADVFGGSWNFRRGQIGSWEEHLTEEHKMMFKAVAGDVLIELGYERDLDW
jgi:hypothetical protein